ncbi:protein-methionine-sulfoxide reductase catalytic subunit MsrP [Polynucleobacter sphagniphilus]|jgi:sulfoxide reductase catalytic subunit YedY|uniref:Protein-methionine-sulfoxide reductase catalytic subunit MsrP n=1 Tax=Polynucleobacter sphagniphilus TaxID=1743169 RepID=A0AA43M8D2_9BURK|nr:protein-methionine-sulfoxide reductase catalytic subunit MsrP [Polynucleobacter sphagniphilus]MDF9788858.1 sulfoxide reductase catalytic subunit YedY [Polynucleobacter sphagniphilus]MDH6154645.1 sulfoxide reductase catalytic subunit YedY [Polynucleobacter sphagniphilus]MDH6241376.1 sulfoxide reductase catalytic subunit YedY [Polynucleobacter sphagniphilus]MDH6250008.1 sulfoxide reductase catalytic subunit YedY [Polynucleobacter sphagniphilus]MDH6300327.1 sulfoxide reductase catalytic subuni
MDSITPKSIFDQRRELIKAAAAGSFGLSLASWFSREALAMAPEKLAATANPLYSSKVDVTPYKSATTYNNFYEFGTDKTDPAAYASSLQTRPWTITIDGLVKKPQTLDIDALLKLAPMEERIYRMRCVEGWSMVIPWDGYSLSKLLSKVEPLGSAKYVEFISLADSKQMPGVKSSIIEWPYREGLRLDEAMNPLTLLTFGMYGELLPKQNGAPVRIVVPWKYGFKSAKSIIKIRLTEEMPKTSWNMFDAHEYGFYSNVNPTVDHPRWSQATERRIGDSKGVFAPKIKTEMFNGYGDQVASMYSGMDLKKYY